MFQTIQSVVLLALGFGFVIFFHELGHFLAAKWVGIRVEQFAVGFGQAVCSWRKGMGFQFGSSGRKFQKLREAAEDGQDSGNLSQYGETEYRINWLPLGGYVKMLGQDDMRPGSEAEDPRAYNKKSIGARMLVVSAGVIMNIILAAIGFMVVFLIGLNVPPAVVGSVMPGSPAQQAGLHVGDQILNINGRVQHDFTKLLLESALAQEGQPLHLTIKRRTGETQTIDLTPRRAIPGSSGFLMMGIGQPIELRGVKLTGTASDDSADNALLHGSAQIKADEVVTAINGQPLGTSATAYQSDFWKLDQAVQQSNGKPVELTLRSDDGAQRTISVQPTFMQPFEANDRLNFAGMLPRTTVNGIMPQSDAVGKLKDGDIVLAIETGQGKKSNPTRAQLVQWITAASDSDSPISLQILRGDQTLTIDDLAAKVPLGNGKKGLGIQLSEDEQHAVVADIMEASAAAQAGIPTGATIIAINEKPVANWFQVRSALAEPSSGEPVKVSAQLASGAARTFELSLDPAILAQLRSYRLTVTLFLQELTQSRHTSNPLQAAWWGVTETRDFILQFYVTIRRMVQGSVSYTNMMGPVGIFAAGTKFADRGIDWLIWFLAMISANLAVVNFLPIPIVDGGLFTFLIIEKIKGKPLSQRSQAIAQYVGLAVLVGVFLLVTYQDIARMLPQ